MIQFYMGVEFVSKGSVKKEFSIDMPRRVQNVPKERKLFKIVLIYQLKLDFIGFSMGN